MVIDDQPLPFAAIVNEVELTKLPFASKQVMVMLPLPGAAAHLA
jgi:hypothetical protein